MKKLLPVLLLFCLLTAQATAESLPPSAQFYESAPYALEVLTFTPLPDGAFVLAGKMPHPGEHRDMPDYTNWHKNEPEEVPADASAVCLEPDGTARWSLRLADPQRENAFRCQGLLPDGRLLISFDTNSSSAFGSQHFIVGTDGIVEEMLPARKIAEKMPPRALQLMPGGYQWDGTIPIDGTWGEAYSRAKILFDFQFNELWRLEYSDRPWYPHPIIEKADGYFVNSSSFLDGTSTLMELSIQKRDPKGNLLWEYKDEPNGYAYSPVLLFPPDGGIVFPLLNEGENFYTVISTLKKLDENGNPLWAKTYDNMAVIWDAAVLGDGFLLVGQKTSKANFLHERLLLHLDANGEVLAELPITGIDGLGAIDPKFAEAPDGSVYLYSNLAAPDDPVESMLTGRISDVERFFYAKIDETTFQ